MYATIASIFDQTVQKFPNKEALVEIRSGRRWTYKEWGKEVTQLANAFLEEGIRKGDRISTFLYNTAELATAYFASAKVGAVINPINFRLKSKEIAYILQDASPKIVIFEKELEEQIAPIQEDFQHIAFWCIDKEVPDYAQSYQKKLSAASCDPVQVNLHESDLYAIMYTSGTTGRPKGVLHRHRDMAEQSYICTGVMKLNPKDRGLVTAPMFHCAELHCTFLPRVHVGAANIILHQFNAKKVLEIIEQEKITTFFAAPTMWNMILQEKVEEYDIQSLRLGLYGAAPMAPVLVKMVKDQLGIDLVQAYGQTEMGPSVTFLLEDEQISKAGSAGKAALNHEIRIVQTREDAPSEPDDILPPWEVGEIIMRGPCMMAGYFNREEASAKALYKGWYHSSDLGYMDEDGYLYVADRVDDMIISGGENIYPREVEDALYEHDGVLDVAVLGEPHEKWGEQVTAIVVKKNPNLTAAELDQFCKQSDRLADYKRPRNYIFMDELPRNASGKIQKFILRKQLKEKADLQK
ncbi:MAG TPA: fatty acid--CoA ligase [Chondromyces sp.]|nr:fatty acid--CoA ligase [Chondromyces sp.]